MNALLPISKPSSQSPLDYPELTHFQRRMKRRPPTEEEIQERLRLGYGSGDGKAYKEWIEFRDLSTRGNASRFTSEVTGRRHTVFSGIEDDLFCTVERQERTVDIQLQRAMEREITVACAKALNVEHPRYDQSDVYAVMSLDAVVKRRHEDGTVRTSVFDSKTSKDLDRRRLEKLSIHKLYCEYVGWSHSIVTEQTFSTQVRKNLAWIRGGRQKEREVVTPPGLFNLYPDRMLAELASLKRHLPLYEFAERFDRRHGLPIGIGLRVCKILAWRHLVHVDVNGPEIESTSTRGLINRSQASGRKALIWGIPKAH